MNAEKKVMKVEAYQPGTEQARNCNLKKETRKKNMITISEISFNAKM